MNLFSKLFIDSDWRIAIRKNQWQWPFNYDVPFEEFKGLKGYWYADPMIITIGDRYYLFCEAFNKKKQLGEIAVSAYNGNEWEVPKIIISNNYHMSYPCVFVVGEDVFMIPESQESKCLELYKADEFPYKWIKVKDLLEDVRIADPTVWENDGVYYLAGYNGKSPYKLTIYQFVPEKGEINYLSSLEYDKNIGRPAGYLIKQSKTYLRPAQDCSIIYGQSLLWYEWRCLNDIINESGVGATDNTKIVVNSHKGVDRIHTFTRAGDFEVIDYCINHFDLFKRLKILLRKQKRGKREKRRNKKHI